MSDLYLLQQQFLTEIYQPSTDLFLAEINPHPNVTPHQQFLIYHHSIVGKLQKALREIYPVCYQLVGHTCFMQLSFDYIRCTPSHTIDLNAYGESFSMYLKNLSQPILPYLADVCRLEWAWHHLFGAANNTPFNFEKLAALDTGDAELVFLVIPGTTLIQSPFPIHTIWEMHQPNSNHEDRLTLPTNQTFYVFVWQHSQIFNMRELNSDQWQLLTWLQEGLTLNQIARLSASLTKPLETLITQCIKQHWISDVKRDDCTT